METRFAPDAERVLEHLEDNDPDAADAVWDVIEMVAADPGSALARRRSLRTLGGHTVWAVPIPMISDEPWLLLWQQQTPDEILVAYVGPADFRPWKM